MTDKDGTIEYTYNAQNRLTLGERSDGQSSAYVYNAMGARVENTQVRENKNAAYQSSDLIDGSHGTDYRDFLSDQRATWQRTWETEVGTTVQNDYETVTQHYIIDYLSMANRDIMVTEDGSWTQRYIYDQSGTRISAEYTHADGTARGTTNADGDYGENFQSDTAVDEVQKVYFRTSSLGSTLFAVDSGGETIAHTIYDPWGKPLTETYVDANYSGLDNVNNYTGYTWDEVLGLYYAQARLYDAETHRFTQEDPIKDRNNWYIYCADNPLTRTDALGLKYAGEVVPWNGNSADIKLIQNRLKTLGYKGANGNDLVDDGIWGTNTEYAVKSFQNANGLKPDGLVGDKTWTALGLPFDQPNNTSGDSDANLSAPAKLYIKYYREIWDKANNNFNSANSAEGRRIATSQKDYAHERADDIRRLDKLGLVKGYVYDVPLFSQGGYLLCWAFSQVMIEAYYKKINCGITMTQAEAIERAKAIAKSVHGPQSEGNWNKGGWPTNSPDVDLVKKVHHTPRGDWTSYDQTVHIITISSASELQSYLAGGPVYGAYAKPSTTSGADHLIVITGVISAPSHEALVISNNPWGDQNIQTFSDFWVRIPGDSSGMKFVGILR